MSEFCALQVWRDTSQVRHSCKNKRIRVDFREGDEDSNFSILRVQRFTEWPRLLHWIAFLVEILNASHFSLKTPDSSIQSALSHPLPKRNGS